MQENAATVENDPELTELYQPDELIEAAIESYEAREEDELAPDVDYDGLPLFDYGRDTEEEEDDIQAYLEDEWSEEDAELFEDTFQDAIEHYDRLLEEVEEETLDARYVAVDEENDAAIEYDVEFMDGPDYPAITVNKVSLPTGLFGFTNTDEKTSERSVQVSNTLYSVDEESTIAHEITHQLHPGKDELTIRYINGDIDPGNTTSLAHKSGGRTPNFDPAVDGYAGR